MSFHTKTVLPFEARIYIGSRAGRYGPPFTLGDVREVIANHQHALGIIYANPVRITPTHYVWDDYGEEGWEIAIINFPRHPKSQRRLRIFAKGLAACLLAHFKQNQVSVVFSDKIIMMEADERDD